VTVGLVEAREDLVFGAEFLSLMTFLGGTGGAGGGGGVGLLDNRRAPTLAEVTYV